MPTQNSENLKIIGIQKELNKVAPYKNRKYKSSAFLYISSKIQKSNLEKLLFILTTKMIRCIQINVARSVPNFY